MSELFRESALPAEVVAAAQRLLDRISALTSGMADAILTQESVYRELSVVPRADLERSCEDHLSWVLNEMTGKHRDTRTAVEVGRRRAEQKVPLQALLHAYRLGARYIATVMFGEASDVVRTDALLPTVNIAWEMLEEYTEAVTTAYLDAVNDRTRRDAESRSALAAAILDGSLHDAPAMAEASRSLGLAGHSAYVVVSIVGNATGGRSVDQRLRGANVVSVWHHEVESHTGIIALPPKGKTDTLRRLIAARPGERVGVSAPFADLRDAVAAATHARLASETAADGETVDYDEAPLQIMVASTPAASGHLVQRVLGPVLDLAERERDMLLETLTAWFANEGSPAKTAAAMFVHRNTIGYRAQRIETLTGRRLTDGRDAAELYVALEAHRLSARQSA